MSTLSLQNLLLRRGGTARISWVDLLLMLLGTGIAYGLMPGSAENLGF